MGLLPVRMETALGLIFVNVSGDAPPLETWLGGLLDTLGPHRPSLDSDEIVATEFGKDYEIRANWKVCSLATLILCTGEMRSLILAHQSITNVANREHIMHTVLRRICCFVSC